jgi:hypothetical protein
MWAEPAIAESAPGAAPEPEPVPAAPVYFAPAIDILPGRPMGGRGKHAAAPPPPEPARVAPVAVAPTPPVATESVRNERADAPPEAPRPHRELASIAPSAPPRQASAATSQPAQFPSEQRAAPQPSAEESEPATPATELDQLARNAQLHSSALSELRGLYEPAFKQTSAPAADAPTGLTRREPRAVVPVAEEELPPVPPRTRDAAEVRGMLSGFRAGVDRGRSAQLATALAGTGSADSGPSDPASTETSPTYYANE